MQDREIISETSEVRFFAD